MWTRCHLLTLFWYLRRLIVGNRDLEQVAVVRSRRGRLLEMLTRLVVLPGSAAWANAGPRTHPPPAPGWNATPCTHVFFVPLGGNVLQGSSLEWWDHPSVEASTLDLITVLCRFTWATHMTCFGESSCLHMHVCCCTLYWLANHLQQALHSSSWVIVAVHFCCCQSPAAKNTRGVSLVTWLCLFTKHDGHFKAF